MPCTIKIKNFDSEIPTFFFSRVFFFLFKFASSFFPGPLIYLNIEFWGKPREMKFVVRHFIYLAIFFFNRMKFQQSPLCDVSQRKALRFFFICRQEINFFKFIYCIFIKSDLVEYQTAQKKMIFILRKVKFLKIKE